MTIWNRETFDSMKTLNTSFLTYVQSYWQGRQDLNLRHPVLETGALPTELLPYMLILGI